MLLVLVAIFGGVLGALTLIGIFVYWFYSCRRLSSRDSDTCSSDPSTVVEMKRDSSENQFGPREFRVEELEEATKQFNEVNLIGSGTFGLVFKGILSDGTIVAIKRRNGYPKQELIEEVVYLWGISHRNLVTLIGYCQERGFQMLVYEYLPNNNMCSHLYETNTKLEFKQRISIAIGAAKGLGHLHGLRPSVVHGNFKTANVLVDENFIAKVSDAGVLKLLDKISGSSTSGTCSYNAFKDPELGEVNILNEMNDVYSFGVFILELISGKDQASSSDKRAYEWVEEDEDEDILVSLNDLMDERLGNFTDQGMRDLMTLMVKCIRVPGKERPTMENIAMELHQILEKEITSTTLMGMGTEGTTTVTLGNKLFAN